jgi:hypothetical protein
VTGQGPGRASHAAFSSVLRQRGCGVQSSVGAAGCRAARCRAVQTLHCRVVWGPRGIISVRLRPSRSRCAHCIPRATATHCVLHCPQFAVCTVCSVQCSPRASCTFLLTLCRALHCTLCSA